MFSNQVNSSVRQLLQKMQQLRLMEKRIRQNTSLDAIISVGYRVKSLRGTQFRIWATSVLRDHLIQGYTVNEKRLAEKGLMEMEQAVALLSQTL